MPFDEKMRYDLDAMAARVGKATCGVYICNPNNPTSTVVDAAKLKAFALDVSKTAPVFIDEAYIDMTDAYPADTTGELVRSGQRRRLQDLLQAPWLGGPAGGLRHHAGRDGREGAAARQRRRHEPPGYRRRHRQLSRPGLPGGDAASSDPRPPPDGGHGRTARSRLRPPIPRPTSSM
ncbi:aminotransferase class I/II-fold pyridoxal phosphate-dependent enzyme [Phenylobacterium sp. J367]|nr:aminotransferase class I/II-fold pyridoxal phosphate-dependent enzyme [Phenylobacterium sp. J367]